MAARGNVLTAKIIVVGPPKCGKTTVCNLLAGVSSTAQTPVQSHSPVRILEFQRQVQVRARPVTVNVQLWDAGGDQKHEPTWDAIRNDAAGAIILYNPVARNQDKELEAWHTTFCKDLKPAQCIIFAHNSTAQELKGVLPKMRVNKQIQQIRTVHTSLELNPEEIKDAVDKLIVQVCAELVQRMDSEELSIING